MALCETAKVIARILDGASERAVLIRDDGVVLHKNSAAEHFLYTKPEQPHVLDFLSIDEPHEKDWRKVEHAHIVMASGTTTRTRRSIHWVSPSQCTCGCGQTYHTAYVCSKHERVREVVDHAFDPVLTADYNGIIITANEAATELFGYTEGELVGNNLSMVCGGGHAEKHDEYIKKYLETGIRKIIGTKREVLAKRKDGKEVPCELGIQEITDVSTGQRFFCGFFKDLTISKQHEAEIQELQDLQQGMINASLDSMLEIDQDGIIRIVNDAACHMFGYKREEFLGSNISMICGGGHDVHHQSYMQHYLTTGEKQIIGRKRKVPAKRRDGSEFDVELSVQEVVLSNGKKAFCGFLRDLTLQQNARKTLRKQREMIHGKFFGKEESEKTHQKHK